MRISNKDHTIIEDEYGNPLFKYLGIHPQDIEDVVLNSKQKYKDLEQDYENLEKEFHDLEDEVAELAYDKDQLTHKLEQSEDLVEVVRSIKAKLKNIDLV